MPNVFFKRVKVAARTTTGTQDITISGFGTPKAAIFILTGATANNSFAAHARISIGFTDGVTSYAAGAASQDASATTNCGRAQASGVINVPNYSGAGYVAQAAFSTWITDGVRINWTTVLGTGVLLEVILINGSDITNIEAGSASLTGTAAINITTGFQADLVISSATGIANNSVGVHSNISLGFYDRVNNTQASAAHAEGDNEVSGQTGGNISTTYGLHTISGAITPAVLWGLTFSSYASGFTVTPNSSPASDAMIYLAIQWNTTVGTAIFTETLPTTAGNYSKTGLSFKPAFGLTLATSVSTAIGTTDGADSNGFCIAAFDADGIDAMSYEAADAVATTVAKSHVSTSYIRDPASNGSTAYTESSIVSWNSDGWTKALQANAGATYKHLSLAIQTFSTVDLSAINGLTQAQTLSAPTLTQHSVLAPASLTQLQTESQPSYFIQHNVLALAGMAQVQTLSLPALVQHSILSPAGLAQIQTLDLPALLQYSVLSPAGLAQLQTLDLPGLLQHGLLSPDALAQLQELIQPSIAATVPLFVDGLAQLQTLGLPSMVLYNALPPDGLMHTQTLGEATMLVYGGVSAYDLMQAQLINEPELLQQNILIVQNMAQAEVLDAVSLVEHNLLVPTDLAQLQTLSEPALISHAILSVNTLSQLQTLSAASLLQHAVVAPAGLAHLVTLSEPALVQIRKVSPLGLVHVQTLTQPILNQPILAAALAHLQEMSTTTLLQHSVLVADVLQQAQQLLEPILRPFFSVTPHGMTQGQTSSHVYIRYVINTMLEGVLRAYAQLDGTLVAEAALEAQLCATASLFGALKSLPVQ